MLDICRGGAVSRTSARQASHSAAATGTLPFADAVALAPESAERGMPGVTALQIAEVGSTWRHTWYGTRDCVPGGCHVP